MTEHEPLCLLALSAPHPFPSGGWHSPAAPESNHSMNHTEQEVSPCPAAHCMTRVEMLTWEKE